jgi:hypothetical protein
MKTSLKLKYNIHTGEFSAITGEGNEISQGLMITDMVISLNAQSIPIVVLTCMVHDDLEIELAEAEIEVHEIKVKK